MLFTGALGAEADSEIGDAGAAAVADAMKVNKIVTTIRLYSACRAAREGPWEVWSS